MNRLPTGSGRADHLRQVGLLVGGGQGPPLPAADSAAHDDQVTGNEWTP
ncbi:hypothetical protein [Lentzea xinjiangensis]|nr:hypothetical protein [Lentzea xinjiangensis]